MERPGVAVSMPRESGRSAALSIRLSAVIVTATVEEPRVLTVRIGHDTIETLPSGPLEVEHRTLEVGLRAWVERQTSQKLGYVEQLYTFGDRDRVEDARAGRALSVAYLALVREARPGSAGEAVWQSWYRYFPWEDWRAGQPATWRAAAASCRSARPTFRSSRSARTSPPRRARWSSRTS